MSIELEEVDEPPATFFEVSDGGGFFDGILATVGAGAAGGGGGDGDGLGGSTTG